VDGPSACGRTRIVNGVSAPTAAFFDLDKTIIAKSSTLAFSKPFFHSGLLNRRTVLRSAYAQFVFALSGADEDQMDRMRGFITSMCAGWNAAQVREIVDETLHQIIDPLVYDEAVWLIAEHKAAGRDVVIVSASGAELVAPIAAMLGADHMVATQMVVEDGRYTGEIANYVYGPAKAEAIHDLARSRGYDLAKCFAYSDSVTDVPMLEIVGYPTAVNPDRALRKVATERGWPIATFSNAVPLRQRIAGLRPTNKAATLTVLGAGVAGVAIAWFLHHRQYSDASKTHKK
jgi:HAD superfamily hydrolase (TIGR01490 family)